MCKDCLKELDVNKIKYISINGPSSCDKTFLPFGVCQRCKKKGELKTIMINNKEIKEVL